MMTRGSVHAFDCTPNFFTGPWNSIRFNISGHEIAFISTTRAMIFGRGGEEGPSGHEFYDIEGTIECIE